MNNGRLIGNCGSHVAYRMAPLQVTVESQLSERKPFKSTYLGNVAHILAEICLQTNRKS